MLRELVRLDLGEHAAKRLLDARVGHARCVELDVHHVRADVDLRHFIRNVSPQSERITQYILCVRSIPRSTLHTKARLYITVTT